MATTTTRFTIGEALHPTHNLYNLENQEDSFWYVYEYGNKYAVFANQEQAEYWCTVNNIEFTVL